MPRYLTEEQLYTNLRLGKAVEQWLSHQQEADYLVLKWLRIDQEKNCKYSLAYFEQFDEGGKDFFDIYEFSMVDPDEPGGVIDTFDSVEEVLEFAIKTYHAIPDKFVSGGLIQEECRDYLSAR